MTGYLIGPQVLQAHPEWAYLLDPALGVRPATETEAAAYAARPGDPEWAALYAPVLPEPGVPPAEAPEVLPAADPIPPTDGEKEAALTQFQAGYDAEHGEPGMPSAEAAEVLPPPFTGEGI